MSDAMVRLLRALGYDPAAVWAKSAHGRTMPGILVTNRNENGADSGKAIRFYTRKELRRRGQDVTTLLAYEAEMKRQEERAT